MIKKFKWQILWSSMIIVLPMVVGFCLWNILPDQIPVHFGVDGQPDRFGSKLEAILFPLLVLAIHWLCIVLSSIFEVKKEAFNSKAYSLVFWICPIISVLCSSLMFTIALGFGLSVGFIMCMFVGLSFVIVGNFLPKCKQSYTLGIKLPWTLHDEDNWNKTHRFGGFVWVIGGLVLMATSFLGSFWVLISVLVLMVVLPTIYSYIYYKNHTHEDK